MSAQRGGSADSETLPEGKGLQGKGSSRGCWVWDPRAAPSRYSPKSTRRVLPAPPAPSPPPARPAAELRPPGPSPRRTPADASKGPGGRWRHLVAEWSLPAGLCWAVTTIPPGSPLLTQPGRGSPSQPQPAHARGCSACAMEVTGWQEGMVGRAAQKSRESVLELSPGETQPPIPSMCEQWGKSAWAEGGCCSIPGGQGEPLTPGTTGHPI